MHTHYVHNGQRLELMHMLVENPRLAQERKQAKKDASAAKVKTGKDASSVSKKALPSNPTVPAEASALPSTPSLGTRPVPQPSLTLLGRGKKAASVWGRWVVCVCTCSSCVTSFVAFVFCILFVQSTKVVVATPSARSLSAPRATRTLASEETPMAVTPRRVGLAAARTPVGASKAVASAASAAAAAGHTPGPVPRPSRSRVVPLPMSTPKARPAHAVPVPKPDPRKTV